MRLDLVVWYNILLFPFVRICTWKVVVRLAVFRGGCDLWKIFLLDVNFLGWGNHTKFSFTLGYFHFFKVNDEFSQLRTMFHNLFGNLYHRGMFFQWLYRQVFLVIDYSSNCIRSIKIFISVRRNVLYIIRKLFFISHLYF